mmetsp:Transcript_3687/g.10678  ORF Transcript_3687/g.10678 Transcript_3687/m.10678 type:complete len:267 (+) Transcript_3687:7454-8254(+)
MHNQTLRLLSCTSCVRSFVFAESWPQCAKDERGDTGCSVRLWPHPITPQLAWAELLRCVGSWPRQTAGRKGLMADLGGSAHCDTHHCLPTDRFVHVLAPLLIELHFGVLGLEVILHTLQVRHLNSADEALVLGVPDLAAQAVLEAGAAATLVLECRLGFCRKLSCRVLSLLRFRHVRCVRLVTRPQSFPAAAVGCSQIPPTQGGDTRSQRELASASRKRVLKTFLDSTRPLKRLANAALTRGRPGGCENSRPGSHVQANENYTILT